MAYFVEICIIKIVFMIMIMIITIIMAYMLAHLIFMCAIKIMKLNKSKLSDEY
jgi:hypothetical protein